MFGREEMRKVEKKKKKHTRKNHPDSWLLKIEWMKTSLWDLNVMNNWHHCSSSNKSITKCSDDNCRIIYSGQSDGQIEMIPFYVLFITTPKLIHGLLEESKNKQ